MSVIQLRHYKKLRYAASTSRGLPELSAQFLGDYAGETVVSFRPLETGRPDEIRREMHGCIRLLDLPKTNLVLVGLGSDSPLAPLLCWDIAHALPVGCSLTILCEPTSKHYLELDYYAQSFQVDQRAAEKLVLRKIAALPAERDAGLDRWTFGIPVGPEDATLLNVCVRRILDLDIAEKEILLCGMPGPGFKYLDKVRIVGEDITAPPVKICTKKNRLAQEARFENLCIIHDRVFLPADFHAAMRKFGDFYPMTAFQSIYFDDVYNCIPRRYSDYNNAPKIVAQAPRGIMRDNDVDNPSQFAFGVLSLTEQTGFYYANPLRHSRTNYVTGSLYICKRSVWERCQQNESLLWTEFEDIDHGLRADAMGIPSRVNPFSITQSLTARPILSFAGSVQFESLAGGSRVYRAAFEPLSIKRKPLLKVTKEQAQRSLVKFSNTYLPEALRGSIPSNLSLGSRLRLRGLIKTVHSTRIPIQRKAIENFLSNYEKQLVFDQAPYNWKEWVTRQLLERGGAALTDLVTTDTQLMNAASQRPKDSIFADTMRDYLPQRGWRIRLGTALSALQIARKNRGIFYLPGGVFRLYRAIYDSTPFADYSEEAQ